MRRPANPQGLFFLLLVLTRGWQQLRQQYGYQTRFPIVTVSLIALCVTIHTNPHLVYPTLRRIFPCDHISDVSIQPATIVHDYQYYRLLSSALFHMSDTHLYYNMMSLLYKGFLLESGSTRSMSSPGFATLCVALTALSHSLMVAFAYLLARFTGRYDEWEGHAVGASALLFALKTIVNLDHDYNQGTHTNIYGFLIPLKWAAWVELALVQLMVPQASFNGHVAGIVAGLLYVYGFKQQTLSIPDTFKRVLAPIVAIFGGNRARARVGGSGAPSFGSGVVGGRVAGQAWPGDEREAAVQGAYRDDRDGLHSRRVARSVPVRPARIPSPSAPPLSPERDPSPAPPSASVPRTFVPSPSPLSSSSTPSPPLPSASSSSSVSASDLFTQNMRRLWSMGYHDRAANHRALVRANGDIEQAIQFLS